MRGHVAGKPDDAASFAALKTVLRSRPAVMHLALVTVGLILLIGWAVKPWQWSLVDDPDYRLGLLKAQQEDGWLGGILERVNVAYTYDRIGGQFRPFLWVYSATFYLLEPGLAHALRLLLLLVAVGSVGLAVRQRLVGVVEPVLTWMVLLWAMAAVASVRGLYDGLAFLSIMELPTVTFVAVAIADRNPARRVLWLSLASLCKTPVVGGLFAVAVVLYRDARRGLALTALLAGVVIVLWARDFALGGSYTANYALTLASAQSTLVGLGRQLGLPVLVLASALLWVRSRPRVSADAFIVGSAGFGYVVLLLPWGSSSGYNLATPAFLLVFCAVLVLTATLRALWSERAASTVGAPARRSARTLRLRLPLLVAVLVAGFVATIGVKAAFDRDSTIRGVVRWAGSLPPGDVVATNGVESSVRYPQLLDLRHGDRPSPSFVYAEPGSALPCSVRWVVAMNDQGPLTLETPLALVLSLPMGDIYRVEHSSGQDPRCGPQ